MLCLRHAATVVCASALLVGCGAGKNPDDGTGLEGDGGSGGFHVDSGAGGDGGLNVDGLVDDAPGPPPSDCPEELKQIYAVTEGNELYRFAPATLAMTRIGTVSCPTSGFGGATPFSMAVDRKGVGWVLFSDGHIFHVSTKDASCTATSFVPDQSGFHTFGMAFVSDSAGSSSESLYVADYASKGVARIDTGTLALKVVGNYGGKSPGAGELTGTGDARMFAFFNKTPSSVAQLDPATSAIMAEKPVPGLTVGLGWAFAHWGGDFWLFTAPSGSSKVTQFDFASGTGKDVVTGLGYVIVGAGVSTCAPTKPPK